MYSRLSNEALYKNENMYNLLQYIENNLSVDLDIGHLSSIGYVSCAQLYRNFYSYTGHTVKEYIRKRRISNACEKIKCSDIPLAVIADESGYQTQQSFHKQFKNLIGMTPLEYRQADSYFYFYPFTINENNFAVKVGTEIIPEYTTTQFYDSCLIGIEDKAIAALGKINGRVFGRNGKQIGNQLCYEVMTEKNPTNMGGAQRRFRASENSERTGDRNLYLYATCVVNYNEPEINNGWNYLYNIWLAISMFEESGNAYFEEYIFSNGKPRKLKLYLPVKKRKTEQHIFITTENCMSFIIARESGYNAERKASEKIMAFLQKRHPLLIRNARKFYVCSYGDVCECGMECNIEFKFPKDSGLEILRIPAGHYAVIHDNHFGDTRVGGTKIDIWLRNNSIAHENKPVFAIYETLNGKYDNENIRMKLYKRLKNDKNG